MSKTSGIIDFIFSRTFLIQLILSLFVLSGILYGTLIYLDKLTLHGEEITVPDLTGIDKNDLPELLKEKNLRFIIIDSSYIGNEKKGMVIGQNPAAMSKVKKDRTIYITVNAMYPPSVRLPVLADKSLRQAKSIIENLGLMLGELIYMPDQCVNCVLTQKLGDIEIENDTVVPKGTMVDLVLGGGLSDEKVLVPLLINLTRDEAIERLKKSFLNIGAGVYDEYVLDKVDSADARIFAQHPAYGIKSWVRMGSSVDVEFTKMPSKIDTNVMPIDSSLFTHAAKDSI